MKPSGNPNDHPRVPALIGLFQRIDVGMRDMPIYNEKIAIDLGEAHKVVIVSVTEGEDKPLKYSGMFAASALMVVTKTDLMPHLDIDIDRLIENARRINPTIGVLKLSAKSGEGMDRWIHWLETARALRLATD